MRLVTFALVVVAWISTAFAQVAAPPPPRVQAEIASLQKRVIDAQMKSAWFAALPHAKKLYELRQKHYPPDQRDVLEEAHTYAMILAQTGDVPRARKVHADAVAAVERKHGPKSRETLNALMRGNSVMWANLDYDAIAPLQKRIMALTKELDGDTSPMYLAQLNVWGSVLMGRNEFGAAIRTYEEALRITESTAKPDTDLISPTYTVAAMAWVTNQRAKAMPLFERVIKLATQKASTDPRYAATMFSAVSQMYATGGRDDLAAPLRKKALDMLHAQLAKAQKADPHGYDVTTYAAMIASTYNTAGDYAQAEKYYNLLIAEEKRRGTPSMYGGMLAELKRAQGKHEEALALYEAAQAELAKVNPSSAEAYASTIAEILLELKQYARAEKVITSYVKNMKTAMYMPPSGIMWAQLTAAHVLMAGGQAAKAEVMLDAALTASEKELATVLSSGTEADHFVFFARSNFTLDLVLNYARSFGAKRRNAHRMAMTTLLRRKGRVLDAAAANLATVRAALSPADKQLLDDLASARSQLAKLMVVGPSGMGGADFAKEVARLEEQVAKLDIEVGKKSAAYRARTQPITLAGVQAQLPPNTKLVELVNYAWSDPKSSWKPNAPQPPRHFIAYVVGRKGEPTFVDLGPAAPIEAAIEKFRVSLANPNDATVTAKGRALFDLTMAKIIPALGTTTDVLLAPDGALNVVPFSALVGADGKFLLEKYTFTYLTSGRDLLRLALRTKARGGGVMFADPAFDTTKQAPTGSPSSRGRRSSDLAGTVWPPLPGTAAEADGVAKAMKLTVYRKERATETALKSVHGPRVLHLATHGFFLPDAPPPKDAAAPQQAPTRIASSPLVPQVATNATENPLLRSGLVFAGADKLSSGEDDGILTALEATGLDLWGTQLVVLSACETGVGKVTNGDGVFGLRRALVIAGAESLVMSLWEVDDNATKDLMVGYYTRLGKKAPRSSALRDVQLELARQPKYQHPFYWASFVPAGANRPLD